ncbi:MAG: hypothetical protein WDM85_07260 [Caulobacteraceae bacterium]
MAHYPNAFLIERLGVLLAKHGRLSRAIGKRRGAPSISAVSAV